MEFDAIVVPEVNGGYKIQKVKLLDDALDPTEVLVESVATGICHSDISCADGTIPKWPFPTILGHEGSGKVVKVGSQVKKVEVGDHVVTSWAYCRDCGSCMGGEPALCDNWGLYNYTTLRKNGKGIYQDNQGNRIHSYLLGQCSFAKMMLLDETSCIKVDKSFSLEDVAPYGCGVITGAGTVLNMAKPRPGSTIAVFGVGAVGGSAVLAAALCPVSKIIVIDLHQSRLDIAKKLGATDIIHSTGQDVAAEIKKLTNGRGVDYAVECTGALACSQQAYDGLAKGGALYAVGIPKAGSKFEIDVGKHLLDMKSYHGALEGNSIPEQLVPQLLELSRSGRFNFRLLTKKYNYKDVQKAVDDMLAGTVIKPILVWE